MLDRLAGADDGGVPQGPGWDFLEAGLTFGVQPFLGYTNGLLFGLHGQCYSYVLQTQILTLGLSKVIEPSRLLLLRTGGFCHSGQRLERLILGAEQVGNLVAS